MSDYWTKNGITKPQSIIVCAACLMQNGSNQYMMVGPRHWDSTMRNQLLDTRIPDDGELTQGEQGFIDQFGDFYNRVDALAIVKTNGQPFNAERNGSDTELFSEGLY